MLIILTFRLRNEIHDFTEVRISANIHSVDTLQKMIDYL